MRRKDSGILCQIESTFLVVAVVLITSYECHCARFLTFLTVCIPEITDASYCKI